MSEDRIDRAHKLRTKIWNWSRVNPASTMEEFAAAFPSVKYETVRKALYRLREEGVICMVGSRGKLGRYSCTGLLPQDVSEARARLRTSKSSAEQEEKRSTSRAARIAAKIARDQQRLKKELAREKAAAEAKAIQKKLNRNPEPWRTVHRAGDTPAIPNQRGQGAVSGRAHVSCAIQY